MRPLRVVLAGSGYVTPFHIAGWQALPDVQVVAIAARNESVAKERARQFGIADICTPPEAHGEQIELAARYGAHVICQKPLAVSVSLAQAMLATVEKAGVRAMVHENFRFRPWFRALGQRLDAGDIGQPFYLRSDLRLAGTVTTSFHPEAPWSLTRQPFFAGLDRFLILESMIHQVDVARYFLGEPKTIYARARRISPHVAGEDLAILHLEFETADA